MPELDAEVEFLAMLDVVSAMDALDATWLNIATRLLTFCARFQRSPTIWTDSRAGEPWGAILAVETRATAALSDVDPGFFAASAPDDGDIGSLSFAMPEHLAVIRSIAEGEFAHGPLPDRQLSLVAIARGLAGAIDNLAGTTYLAWFRNLGEVRLDPGASYPVRGHDPRPWLGGHKPNSNPSNLPRRNLAWTRRLRIADEYSFTYVIDFEMWNRLSPIGSRDGLVIAVAQPNDDLAQFDIAWHTDGEATYANRGPKDRRDQAARMVRLIDVATENGAEIILMPEYSLTEDIRDDLVNHLSEHATGPLLFCAGITGAPDDDGYVSNEAFLLVITPGVNNHYSPHLTAKIYGAAVGGFDERIKAASEVRVFMSQHWTLATLICRDSMDDEILHQLSIIGTNLLLVPAMSQRTETMVSAVSSLCYRSQAFTAVANGPARWTDSTIEHAAALVQSFPPPVDDSDVATGPPERCEAFFAGPYSNQPATFRLPDDRRKTTELGLWIFWPARRGVSRQQIQ